LSFPLELALLVLGAWLYARQTRFGNLSGKRLYWGFVFLLAALQVYGNFGPAPSSPRSMAITAFSFYVVLALVAALVERLAAGSTRVGAAS
jgi:hypothetical protein